MIISSIRLLERRRRLAAWRSSSYKSPSLTLHLHFPSFEPPHRIINTDYDYYSRAVTIETLFHTYDSVLFPFAAVPRLRNIARGAYLGAISQATCERFIVIDIFRAPVSRVAFPSPLRAPQAEGKLVEHSASSYKSTSSIGALNTYTKIASPQSCRRSYEVSRMSLRATHRSR